MEIEVLTSTSKEQEEEEKEAEEAEEAEEVEEDAELLLASLLLLSEEGCSPPLPSDYYGVAQQLPEQCWGCEWIHPRPEGPLQHCCLIPTIAGMGLLGKRLAGLNPEVIVSIGSGAGLVEWLLSARFPEIICVDEFYAPVRADSALPGPEIGKTRGSGCGLGESEGHGHCHTQADVDVGDNLHEDKENGRKNNEEKLDTYDAGNKDDKQEKKKEPKLESIECSLEEADVNEWVLPLLKSDVRASWTQDDDGKSANTRLPLRFLEIDHAPERLRHLLHGRRCALFLSWPQLGVEEIACYAHACGSASGNLAGLVLVHGENCVPESPADIAKAAGLSVEPVAKEGEAVPCLSEPCTLWTFQAVYQDTTTTCCSLPSSCSSLTKEGEEATKRMAEELAGRGGGCLASSSEVAVAAAAAAAVAATGQEDSAPPPRKKACSGE